MIADVAMYQIFLFSGQAKSLKTAVRVISTRTVNTQQTRYIVGLMLDYSLRRWPNINPALFYYITLSSISLVWAAERQKRALDSMIGVAGKPTHTTAIPLFKHSRLKALQPKNWLVTLHHSITSD